jgi:hypothetical protein
VCLVLLSIEKSHPWYLLAHSLWHVGIFSLLSLGIKRRQQGEKIKHCNDRKKLKNKTKSRKKNEGWEKT